MTEFWNNDRVEQLIKPLDRKHVRERTQSGRTLSYIEGWHAIREANRIFGFGGWTRDTIEMRLVYEKPRKIGREQKDGWGVTYVGRVRVTVGGVFRDGTGAGHGIDVDLGQAHESGVKEAETDALKRALMTFGYPFGLALYDKTQEHVAEETEPEPVNEAQDGYFTSATIVIKDAEQADKLKLWWNSATSKANRAELPRDLQVQLLEACKAKLLELETSANASR
jgi:DNA recombination protein Rad52